MYRDLLWYLFWPCLLTNHFKTHSNKFSDIYSLLWKCFLQPFLSSIYHYHTKSKLQRENTYIGTSLCISWSCTAIYSQTFILCVKVLFFFFYEIFRFKTQKLFSFTQHLTKPRNEYSVKSATSHQLSNLVCFITFTCRATMIRLTSQGY